jgi:preprotein translocase subunit SecB
MEPVVNLDSFVMMRSNIEMFPPDDKTVNSAVNNKVQLKYNSAITYSVGKNQNNEYNYKLSLGVKVIPEGYGWNIDVEIAGIFTFPSGTDSNDMEGIIRVNGCTILYGLLRGHLASVTGAFPSGPYVLPTVNMLEVVKRIEESRR